jgi:hypothetical protein
MPTINETVAGYIAAWNETDAVRRRDIIARTWSEGGSYLDAHAMAPDTPRSTR